MGSSDAYPGRTTRAPMRRGFVVERSALKVAVTLVSALSCVGCSGLLGVDSKGGEDDSSARVVGEDDVPTNSTRFRRLTHPQWRSTVTDLFALEGGSTISDLLGEQIANFRDDPVQGGFLFDGNGDSLDVDSLLWDSYNDAALDIAAEFVADADLVSALVPDGDTDQERARAFIEDFGARVHRRPLTDAQVDTYLALYIEGTTAYSETPGFLGGVRLLVEAFLQSPYFLYRVESSDDVHDGMIPLDGYERAVRLSYFFWGTMPDAALFSKAKSGDLDSREGVVAEATRLVNDPRARGAVVTFFEKLLAVDKYANVAPSASAFPEVGATFPASLAGETRYFLEGEMYDADGGIFEFLTSARTYVNAELAAVYDLPGTFGDEFRAVDLDPTQRSGVFTQAGFLAVNATSMNPDPIHRGVFLAKRINCITIAAPPDDIPPLPTPSGQSNRQLVAEHTEAEGTSCRNCHSTIINPFGFAFEHFDAVGAYRTQDGPHQVDASADVFVNGEYSFVSGAVDLARLMAESKEVHECISSHLVAYAQGRNVVPEDEKLVSDLGGSSLGGTSFRNLMVELAAADSFLNRPEVMP